MVLLNVLKLQWETKKIGTDERNVLCLFPFSEMKPAHSMTSYAKLKAKEDKLRVIRLRWVNGRP